MALNITINSHEITVSEDEERRVAHHLGALDRRLIHHPDPQATLTLRRHTQQRRYEANLTIELGPLGGHLVSHQSAESIDEAVRLTAEDIERQLERQHATQRGEDSFGVPSRRRPPDE